MVGLPPGCYRPGTRVPYSGLVRVAGTQFEVTVVEGEPFPATPLMGQCYVYVRLSFHRGMSR
jgi:hypothetical protein